MTQVVAEPQEFFALFAADRRPDPYPHYAHWRERWPVAELAERMFAVSGLAEATQVLRDPAFGHPEPEYLDPADRLPDQPVDKSGRVVRAFLSLNPPDHTRLRRLVAKAFTPRMVERLAPRIEEITAESLDRAPAEFDLMTSLAKPLPVEVIAELLGVPLDDREQFAAWSHAMARALDPPFLQRPETIEPAVKARQSFVGYFRELADRRRSEPGEDLLSALVAVSDAGDVLTEGELLVTLTLLLIAGHETTTNLIGNGVLALLHHPDGLRAAADAPDRVVEEVLRYDSPVQLTARTALRDTTLGAVPVPAGSQAIALLGAANRDPAASPDPDRFDPARPAARHLAFGQGIHFCLGAPLARLEGRIVFRELARRLPDLKLAGTPEWNPTTTLRGLATLPVAR
ncbi:cytochrome P450 [Amycolatopsis lexingtonensis]|uniref:Cytochrome P450 n=1 Tax=Amycolatopsis lexingtonensis TaxID=218822 RepID=A0ABR9ID56_9PSEU|nr:cytochrome P450 [Amycolatopsis lexingtonensis]MBE1501114.1 cytochrome P450 [Amycolatopsis lexingtonensis]